MLRDILVCLLLVACIGLVVIAANVLSLIPKHIDDARGALIGEIASLRSDALAEVHVQATALQSNTSATSKQLLQVADQRIGDTLSRVDRTLVLLEGMRGDVQPVLVGMQPVLSSLPPAVAQLSGDLHSTLQGVDALTKDGKDSMDDLYWDVKASVESGTVAMRGIAETSEAVGKATPAIAQSVNGIAADVHTATSDFTKPRTFWQKVKAWLETSGKIAARFI